MDIGPIYQEQEQWYQLCDFLKFIYCGVGEVGGLLILKFSVTFGKSYYLYQI